MNIDKILSLVSRFVSFVLYLFAIYLTVYLAITFFVFGNYFIPINYILYILVVALGASLLLSIILSINSLNDLIQVLLVYATIVSSIYFVGFFTNCFIRNSTFWISSIIINLVGLCILFVVIAIRRTYENKLLNQTLKNFKERDGK